MKDGAPSLTAREILAATGGNPIQGGLDWSCRGISTDTRTLASGELFVALAGENFDGHDWLAEAARRGASGLLIRADAAKRAGGLADGPAAIAVPDTLVALGDLARDWRRRFRIPLVAITGSSGKTTTKEMFAAIASGSGGTLKTEGNLNNRIGLPLTLFGLRDRHRIAVVEMGMNRPGEIAQLTAIAEPDVGLITNIGPAHIEGMGSLAAIREEKGSLFRVMAGRGTAIVNHDDPEIAVLASRLQGRRVTFGLAAGARVTARGIGAAGPAGVRFELVIDGVATELSLPAAGEHNIRNALAAAAAAVALGIAADAIAAGLAAFRPVPGRSEIRRLGNGAHLVVDTYNANPASVTAALATLQQMHGRGRAFAVLGDMLELGGEAEAWHRRIGALVAKQRLDGLFLKGTLTRALAAGAIEAGYPAERIRHFDDPAEVVRALQNRLGKGDWLLLKGSRKMKLEAVTEKIIEAFDLDPQTV